MHTVKINCMIIYLFSINRSLYIYHLHGPLSHFVMHVINGALDSVIPFGDLFSVGSNACVQLVRTLTYGLDPTLDGTTNMCVTYVLTRSEEHTLEAISKGNIRGEIETWKTINRSNRNHLGCSSRR